jgi:hypothetical protein
MSDALSYITEGYGYFWFRHHKDGFTFIACREDDGGPWFMPGLGHPVSNVEGYATLLGRVPRTVVGGGSIDQ